MRGISWRNLDTHYSLVFCGVTGRHKYIAKNAKGDKFYLVDGFNDELRVVAPLTAEEVAKRIEEDKVKEAKEAQEAKEAREKKSNKMNLTNEQLDLLIKITNYAFDFSGAKSGEHKKWHEIAGKIALYEFDVYEYDAEAVDKRTIELGELEDTDDCDADLDAYSRRFDCEV